MSRPKFASRKTVDLEEQGTTRPGRSASSSSVVAVDNQSAIKAVKGGVSALTKLIMAVVAIVLVLYLALAATLMVAAPGDTGLTWVVRNTFAGGRPDPGDFVYASSEEVKKGPADNVLQAFLGVPDAMVLETVAGPHDNITLSKDGEVLADGEPTGYFGDVEERRLVNEYVMACITGACEDDSLVILPLNNIAGEAKGGMSFEGIGSYDSVRKP